MTFPVPGGSTFLKARENLADVADAETAFENISPLTIKGDLLYENATPAPARLAIGSAGQVLGLAAGVPAWGMGMTLLAATVTAGYTLVNGTGTIISWTAPNDGKLHRVALFGTLRVTSNETAGQIRLTYTDPGGTSVPVTVNAGGAAAGGYLLTASLAMVEANMAVILSQNSALTGGAAVLWAELWGS